MSFSSLEERPSTANNLWRQPSMRSATSSIITSSSGGEDSFQSLETLSTDLTLPYSQSIDQLSILQDGSAHYYQLIDDLSIIDDLYQSFQPDEIEEDIYGKLKKKNGAQCVYLYLNWDRATSSRCSQKRSTEKT